MSAKSPARDGLGVDRTGGPVIDPTANVIALNDAATKRQDDLRAAHQRYVDAQIAHVKEIGELRASHAKEIRQLETERLNSIRSVDVAGGEREAKRALDAVQALAATSATNTETLRNAVTSSATAIAKQTAETFAEVSARLAALERSSYEGKGKEAVADPALVALVQEVKSLATSVSTGSGKSQGISAVWAAVVVSVGLLGTLLGIGSFIYKAGAPAPQVIYQQAPAK